MNEKAANVISAIEHATRHMRKAEGGHESPPLDPHDTWSEHCSAMFRETMRQMALRFKAHVDRRYQDENANANALGERIRRHHEDWQEILLSEAQDLANRGNFVIGSYINPSGESGHIGIVYPVDAPRSVPLIRDGNIHKDRLTGEIKATSSYGAVSAPKAFPLGSTKWFRFRRY